MIRWYYWQLQLRQSKLPLEKVAKYTKIIPLKTHNHCIGRNFNSKSSQKAAFTGFLGLKKLIRKPLLETVGETTESNIPRGFTIESENSAIAEEIFNLKSQKNYKEIIRILDSQYALGRILAPHLFLDLIDLPKTDLNSIESPSFAEIYPNELSELIVFYTALCNKYEKILMSNISFQELFIRICYHSGDTEKLAQLVDLYLKNEIEELKSDTLVYILNGFAMNFEVNLSKSLFVTFTNLKKDLDMRVLEHVLLVYIKAGSLFENLLHILQSWILSRNPLPSARAMSIVFSQAYKYATLEELQEIDLLIHRYNLNQHYLIRQVRLKEQICNRESSRNCFKKEVLSEDIVEFNEIALELYQQNQLSELTEFYRTMLDFFTRYSTSKYVELVLFKSKEDGISIDDTFYELLMRYYLIHEKFLGLVHLLESITNKIDFKLSYLKIICEAFTRTYPYYAGEFYEKYMTFIDTTKLTLPEKQTLKKVIKIKRLDSQIRPFGFGEKTIDTRKMKLPDWEIMSKTMEKGRRRRQVKFRVEKGFDDLVSRGIKPDISIVEETFRRGSLYHKTKILELSQVIRIPVKHQNRLSIINLQFATKPELQKFFKYNLEALNCNDKLSFSRILRNNDLNHECHYVLNQINPEELVDNSKLVLFVSKLRTLIKLAHFEEMIQVIEQFPVQDTHLSPYLLKQCVQLEQKLINLGLQPSDPCLIRFRGFIGDIKIILHKDKLDLDQRVSQLFAMIDNWIQS